MEELTHKVDQVNPEELTVYLPDTRGASISQWGKGNLKLGPDVYTYSRLPGRLAGTCPGATAECQDICYAMRVRGSTPDVWALWTENSETESAPGTVPPGCQIVRFHVGGDFSTNEYIMSWIGLVNRNLDVRFFGFTHSWRVPELLETLTMLKERPNVQLLASADADTDFPPRGWRVAWIEDSKYVIKESDESQFFQVNEGYGKPVTRAYICPEQTGRKPDCQTCQYCIKGTKGDVVFLKH